MTLLDFVVRNQEFVVAACIALLLGFYELARYRQITPKIKNIIGLTSNITALSVQISAPLFLFVVFSFILKAVQPIPPTIALDLPDVERVDDSEETESLVILIHGWLGDKEGTWKKFPDLVRQDSNINADLMVVDYPTYLVRRNLRLIELSDWLEKRLRAEGIYNKYKSIAVLAHSMGGLVARKMILLRAVSEGSSGPYGLVVSIASPLNGAPRARLAKILGISKQLTRGMEPGSDFLINLQKEWERLGGRLNQRPRTNCISSEFDKVVPAESALFQCDDTVKLPNAWGHRDLVKPNSRYDDRYVLPMASIREFFQQSGSGAIERSFAGNSGDRILN